MAMIIAPRRLPPHFNVVASPVHEPPIKICVIVVPILAMINVIVHGQANARSKPATDRRSPRASRLHGPDRRGDLNQIEQAKDQRDPQTSQYFRTEQSPNSSSVTPRNSGMPTIMTCVRCRCIRSPSVSQLISTRSKIQNQPGHGPNPSKIASAWPRWVPRHFLHVIVRTESIEPVLAHGLRIGGDAAGNSP